MIIRIKEMHIIIGLALLCTAVSASISQRIVGGSPTYIDNYPSIVGFLRAPDGITFRHNCGGSMLNERSILTAAHCDVDGNLSRYRVRVGSTYGNSGGFVHNIARIINHEDYNRFTLDNDIAILHTATHIGLSNVVQQAMIAGTNFVVPDNSEVWAAGWGVMEDRVKPEQLRHVALSSMPQDECERWFPSFVTANMLCAISPSTAEAGQCNADSGGPLYYRNVVVGVCSFGTGTCGRGPSVSARVSRYTNWILENIFS